MVAGTRAWHQRVALGRFNFSIFSSCARGKLKKTEKQQIQTFVQYSGETSTVCAPTRHAGCRADRARPGKGGSHRPVQLAAILWRWGAPCTCGLRGGEDEDVSDDSEARVGFCRDARLQRSEFIPETM
jgi:hypothetical protein